MPITADLASLHGIGLRATSYRFDLLDNDEAVIGALHPVRDEGLTPVITHDRSRLIMRDMTNLNLAPDETAHVNPLSDRVRPWMLLEDGSEHPLGVFIFAEASAPHYSYGRTLSSSLVDKSIILDQPLDHSVSVSAGWYVRPIILALFAEVDVDVAVDSSGVTFGGPMSWAAGTSRMQVIVDLCTVAGYMPPFFHHTGVCHVHQFIDPDDHDVDVSYGEGHNIYAASPVETNDLLRTPNRVVMVGNDANNTPVVGSYDVPAGSPFSFEVRGFRVVEVIQQQGLESNATAAAAARTYALTRHVFEHVSFSGPPDPRHDGHTVVDYLGEHWLESQWSLPLTAHGPMTHTLQKVYS